MLLRQIRLTPALLNPACVGRGGGAGAMAMPERDIEQEMIRMENNRVTERKRFEYGLRRHFLNGSTSTHLESLHERPRYTMEPPSWVQTREQAHSRIISAPEENKPKKQIVLSKKSKQLPSLRKEPSVADNQKLAGIIGLWGKTPKRTEVQWDLDESRRRVEEANQVRGGRA